MPGPTRRPLPKVASGRNGYGSATTVGRDIETSIVDDIGVGNIPGMTVTVSITVDAELGRDLDAFVAGGNRSAVVAQAIREYLDRRNIAAAAAWHASLDGEDAAALAEFDAAW
jgi:predicted transcriptional regulator